MEVQGFDLLPRLSRGTVYRQFGGESPGSGLPDSEIVKQIAEEMQLKLIVEKTEKRVSPRIQNNETNLDFLQRLAQLNGYVLNGDSDTIYFGGTPATTRKTIRLEWGKNLLNFSPRLSTAGLVNEVVVRSWDPIHKQPISGDALKRANETAGFLSEAG